MNRDQIWPVIHAQRGAVAALLETLSDEEWRRPSLCEGWTVRDVAAHLTLQDVGFGGALGMLLRWRGSLDRTIQHAAHRRAAALSTGQIVAGVRGTPDARRHNFGVTHVETLTDILVHGQDIAVPLGRDLHTPAEAAAVATTRTLTMKLPPPPPSAKRLTGFRLVATDTAWTHGEGPEVRAPMAALLLLACGRLTALPQLSGAGAAQLTGRLSAGARHNG
ncbi:maleylpyruvate isomerase family mycothiol-dependent enzyme [Dactylosporangium sp. NPDC049742]|uniref:maleylpyruvate isomerase family mycothiol-dependent enzyme n=1 Tax=Dactylosporangium sp. NPDC049742 TaxID=3154737 RepID=UPI0034138B5B